MRSRKGDVHGVNWVSSAKVFGRGRHICRVSASDVIVAGRPLLLDGPSACFVSVFSLVSSGLVESSETTLDLAQT